MKFQVSMPGLIRYPPSAFVPGSDHWQARMTCADYQRVARAADELGFHALSVSEHLLLPVDLAPKMGSHYPHGITAMAFLAGATNRIRVNSMVIPLPYHHPVSMAKAIATLDVMSGGRVTVTFGVGMAPVEFGALGIAYEQRGRITDESVQVMKELWAADRPTFAGEYTSFSDVVFEPKPVQQPHPPLWFGGRSNAAMRRAATAGDGWAPAGAVMGSGPWLEEPDQLPAWLERAHELRAAAGIDRPFDVFMSLVQARFGPGHTELPPTFVPRSAQEIVDEIGRLADLGVTWTMVTRPDPNDDSLEGYLDDLHWLADEVVAVF